MDALTIIPFVPEHAQQISLPEYDNQIQERSDGEEMAKMVSSFGPAWTAVRIGDGKIICCAGIMIGPDMIGEAWALFSDEIGKHKKEIYQRMRWYLRHVITDLGLVKVRAYRRIDYPLKVSFTDRFGFVESGTYFGHKRFVLESGAGEKWLATARR